VTVTECASDVPLGPSHVRVNVLFDVSAPVLSLPDVALAPVQALNAAQPVAFVEDQVSVADCPDMTDAVLTDKVAVGTGAMLTVTDSVVEVPPRPSHARLNVLGDVSAPVLSLPDVALVPVHEPEAVHVVASIDDQVSVAAWPEFTIVVLTESVTVGAATCGTVIAVGQEFTGVIVGTDDVAEFDVIVTSALSVAL
jgi:hypothetical protein